MRGPAQILFLLFAEFSTAKCPAGATVGPSGECYIIRFTQKSWNDAVADCNKRGGTLASIHSKETNDFLGQWLLNYVADVPNRAALWIGATSHTPKVRDSWRWLDNSPFNYSNWKPGK